MQREGSTGSRLRGVPAAVKEILLVSEPDEAEAWVVVVLAAFPVCILLIVLIDLVYICRMELFEDVDEMTATGDCRY